MSMVVWIVFVYLFSFRFGKNCMHSWILEWCSGANFHSNKVMIHERDVSLDA